MEPGRILMNVGIVRVEENSIMRLICGMWISCVLCPSSRMYMFADLENIAVESIRTYSPYSVSLLITALQLSWGSEESIEDMDPALMLSSMTCDR